VTHLSQKPKHSALTRHPFQAALLKFCAVLAFALLGSGPLFLASASPSEVPSGSALTPISRSNLSFAAADFDGDNRADIANVQSGREDSGRIAQFVRLRLSASGRHFIRIAVPDGTLSIEAVDVNGDHAIDLVISSRWLNQPVTILLNDGHGNFSQSDPSKYVSRPSESNSLSEIRPATWSEFAVAAPRAPAFQLGAQGLAFALPRGEIESRIAFGLVLNDSSESSNPSRGPPSYPNLTIS
jgi:hypothetical protein